MAGKVTTLVCHVKKGFEDRAEHIRKMLAAKGMEYEWMLDGDIPDITEAERDRYFAKEGEMAGVSAKVSCALKHVLCYRYIVEHSLPGALILEDDIELRGKWDEVFPATLREVEAMGEATPVLVSYEDSRLRFVPGSQRRKGQYLYPGDRDRYAGCYYVNAAAARVMLSELERERMSVPIDHYHRKMLSEGKIRYLWCQPTVARQGSQNGRFDSGINTSKGRWMTLKWRIKLIYKKILYKFR